MTDQIGPCLIVRAVGRGGMGIVYEAVDTRCGERVALKVLHPHLLENPSALKRFRLEALHAARIAHPNVVCATELHEAGERIAIEMPFVEGTSLQTLLQSGPLSLWQVIDLMRQLLSGLAACHAEGVVHCDLKPGNLLITREGHLYITDFGVASALLLSDATQGSLNPTTGPIWGTPQYSPPEAWHGEKATVQWDLFAVGVLMHEALTGKPPFQAQSAHALMHEILTKDVARLHVVFPEISEAFSSLIHSLLEKEPSARPKTAEAVLESLQAVPESSLYPSETEPLPRAIPLRASAPSSRDAQTPLNTVKTQARWLWGTPAALGLLALAIASIPLLDWGMNRDRISELPIGADPVSLSPSSTDVVFARDDLTNQPEYLIAESDYVYFSFDDGTHGRELWAKYVDSDETMMVVDLAPGPASSNPRRAMVRPYGGFVFAATTPDTGEELWSCANQGGYSLVVSQIKDIIPGPMGSEPEPVASYENLVVFYATTLESGRELWCTNMHEAQTAMVMDLFAGRQGSAAMKPNLSADGADVYFRGDVDYARGTMLLAYDFRSNSIRELCDLAESVASIACLDDDIFFDNWDPEHGRELWTYTPATGESQLFADLNAGPDSSSPDQFYKCGERIFFQARDAVHGLELWSTDGTVPGTTITADLNPGPADSAPYGFVACAGRVFFRAHDSGTGSELWVSRGTRETTRRVADFKKGPESGNPYNITAIGQYLFFTVDDGVHGEELWWLRADDDPCEVKLVTDLLPGQEGSEPYNLTPTKPNRGAFFAWISEKERTLCTLEVSDSPIVKVFKTGPR